jgi:hypothetical protein
MDENELKVQFDQLLRDVTGLLQDPNHHFEGEAQADWIRRLERAAALCREKGWSVAERTFEFRAKQVAANSQAVGPN